ncbi:hypothetical protein ARMSODRAFT_1091077 [Armillaria solidipes]|uniref:Uncharacterized protein n=1 Tax=Armillaria solidipes TaxID=1076256 RepID=A0A2H3AIW2_9AGAR|nr:hypothetical protein ARMSODRAFT_1091077 [Armillaria solidipes]
MAQMEQRIAQLKASGEAMKQIAQLKAKNEARERELDEQLRYEVAKRFCRGLSDMLCNKLDKLPGLLSDLASELHNPGLRYAPNAFVLLTYYHHYNDDTLPDIFYEFSERVHQMNVTALEDITPGARTTFTALDALTSGPHGDEIKLLVHLWAVRAGLGKKLNMLAYPVPHFAFALEILHQLIPDPDQQALMERLLPSLVEEVAFSEHIKYFMR